MTTETTPTAEPPSPLVTPEFAASLRYTKQYTDALRQGTRPGRILLIILTFGLSAVFFLHSDTHGIKKYQPGPDDEPVPWDVLCEELHPPGLPGILRINGMIIDPSPNCYTGPVYRGPKTYTGPPATGMRLTPEQIERDYRPSLAGKTTIDSKAGEVEYEGVPARRKTPKEPKAAPAAVESKVVA